MNPTFFDCFSGIGGFRLGMTRAGFKCVGYCEKDDAARAFYQKYFNPVGEYELDDITTISAEISKVPPFDCLCFGAPCQPFSNAGHRKGMADERGSPLWEALFQLLRVKKPPVFLLEEVPGLLTVHEGQDFAWILAQVSEAGFDCEWSCVDWRAHNIPQARQRLFVVGHYRGASRSEVFPLGPEEAELYQPPPKEGNRGEGSSGASITPTTLLKHDERFNPRIVLGNATPTITAGYRKDKASPTITTSHEEQDISRGALIINDGVPEPRISLNPATPTITTEYRRKGAASPTIVAGYNKRGASLPYLHLVRYTGANTKERIQQRDSTWSIDTTASKQGFSVSMDDDIRMFTPREVFRLQGFPEDFINMMLAQEFSETALYRFAGNAVAPQPVTSIAKKLFIEKK